MKNQMKLGTETGSFVNFLYSGIKNETPDVNKGATILHWTDRTAFFVNSVSKCGKKCQIERAKSVRTDNNGMSECQDYKYEREENPIVYNLVFRYGNWWKENGKDAFDRFSKINIKFGRMESYHDYSF